jgi:shikimate dehydrogenase
VPEEFAQPINASTRFCAVYGHPIEHSASPAMQNAGIAALGLNWRYLAFQVRPDNLRAAIEGAKAMRFIGLNLTVPHKLLAMDMVDALDESAQMWGAVNTICFEGRDAGSAWLPLHQFGAPPAGGSASSSQSPEGGTPNGDPCEVRSRGFNTDADGIARSLRADLDVEVRGARVLLLGAGGAGRVAALKLAAEGVAELFLVNRTRAKAEEIAQKIGKRNPDVRVTIGYPRPPVDLLLNATSLGLKIGDALPLDEKQFALRDARTVYDMVYRPAETALLRAARAVGCRAANGSGMLLYQGAKALEIWSGKPAPLETMRRALLENVYGQ